MLHKSAGIMNAVETVNALLATTRCWTFDAGAYLYSDRR